VSIWGALSDERSGLSFTIAAGPCQSSHSQVRVQRDSWPHFTASDSRLPFFRLLRLAGLQWRYSTPPPRGITEVLWILHPLGTDQAQKTQHSTVAWRIPHRKYSSTVACCRSHRKHSFLYCCMLERVYQLLSSNALMKSVTVFSEWTLCAYVLCWRAVTTSQDRGYSVPIVSVFPLT
jgi:hypothetical protein